MKLFRHGPLGAEKPGMLDAQGGLRDLSAHISDLSGSALGPAHLARLRTIDPTRLPLLDPQTRLGACVGAVPNILCIGLNYTDHAAEAGMPMPSHPIVFSKHSGALSGPCDDVWLPPGAQKLDWEVELGVVIGTPAWHVSEAQALTHVAGYCLLNDVSERAHQLEMQGQWIKGKSYPSHCPTGPWLVTPDEIEDVQNIDLWLQVNGQTRQSGNTRTMVFSVARLISTLSRYMALQSGDLIATGTPPGVGMGHKPPIYLAAGDVMTLGARGLGEQSCRVCPSPEPAPALAQDR